MRRSPKIERCKEERMPHSTRKNTLLLAIFLLGPVVLGGCEEWDKFRDVVGLKDESGSSASSASPFPEKFTGKTKRSELNLAPAAQTMSSTQYQAITRLRGADSVSTHNTRHRATIQFKP
jgi:hypothetical protein